MSDYEQDLFHGLEMAVRRNLLNKQKRIIKSIVTRAISQEDLFGRLLMMKACMESNMNKEETNA